MSRPRGGKHRCYCYMCTLAKKNRRHKERDSRKSIEEQLSDA